MHKSAKNSSQHPLSKISCHIELVVVVLMLPLTYSDVKIMIFRHLMHYSTLECFWQIFSDMKSMTSEMNKKGVVCMYMKSMEKQIDL